MVSFPAISGVAVRDYLCVQTLTQFYPWIILAVTTLPPTSEITHPPPPGKPRAETWQPCAGEILQALAADEPLSCSAASSSPAGWSQLLKDSETRTQELGVRHSPGDWQHRPGRAGALHSHPKPISMAELAAGKKGELRPGLLSDLPPILQFRPGDQTSPGTAVGRVGKQRWGCWSRAGSCLPLPEMVGPFLIQSGGSSGLRGRRSLRSGWLWRTAHPEEPIRGWEGLSHRRLLRSYQEKGWIRPPGMMSESVPSSSAKPQMYVAGDFQVRQGSLGGTRVQSPPLDS